MAKIGETIDRVERTGFEFLMTDLDLALTMARIAEQSPDDEKRARNTQMSRRAYDAVLRIGSRSRLTAEESGKINEKVKELKSALKSLGEKF